MQLQQYKLFKKESSHKKLILKNDILTHYQWKSYIYNSPLPLLLLIIILAIYTNIIYLYHILSFFHSFLSFLHSFTLTHSLSLYITLSLPTPCVCRVCPHRGGGLGGGMADVGCGWDMRRDERWGWNMRREMRDKNEIWEEMRDKNEIWEEMREKWEIMRRVRGKGMNRGMIDGEGREIKRRRSGREMKECECGWMDGELCEQMWWKRRGLNTSEYKSGYKCGYERIWKKNKLLKAKNGNKNGNENIMFDVRE